MADPNVGIFIAGAFLLLVSGYAIGYSTCLREHKIQYNPAPASNPKIVPIDSKWNPQGKREAR